MITIPMTIATDSIQLPANIDAVYVKTSTEVNTDYDYYHGTYSVVPRLSTQNLATQNKVLSRNITVHPIPVSKVSNLYEGYTVVIG